MSDSPRSTQTQAANTRSVNPAADRETSATVPAPQVSHSGPKSGNTRKKKVPEDLKLRALPSVEEILEAIPREGISTNDFVAKFRNSIDETNARLCNHLLEGLCTVDSSLRLRTRPDGDMPSTAQIGDIFSEARRPPPRKPELNPGEKYECTSEFLGSPQVTFGQPAEVIRGESKILYRWLYRTFYEDSATLCAYVSTHTQPKYREIPGLDLQLKLNEGNAFQSLAKPAVKDLTKQRIERHLNWQQKHPPSSYISAFNHISHARERAKFHTKTSGRIGYRISCAKISTEGMVAATIRGKISKTVKTFRPDLLGQELINYKTVEQDVHIPIWVRPRVAADGHLAISLQDLIDSDAEIWMSITELRLCDMKVPASKGHHYEWLALGRISKASIVDIMPYDGEVLHMSNPGRVVDSLKSQEPFVFKYETWMWCRDTEEAKLARSQRENRKAQRLRKAQGIDSDDNEEDGQASKRQKICPTSDERVPEETDSNEPAEITEPASMAFEELQADGVASNAECCPMCGQTLPQSAETADII